MRLICPNCDAQYEVPDEVMPPQGRDVQCSNCSQTWFQAHPDQADAKPEMVAAGEMADAAAEDALTATVTPETHAAPKPGPERKPEPAGDLPPFIGGAQVPRRRPIDSAIADVLRAEAELEAKARNSEKVGMESQPDLGLGDAQHDAGLQLRQSHNATVRIHAEDPLFDDIEDEFHQPTPRTLGARRDLLPDIEEINSTLRSNSDRTPNADAGQTAQIETREKRSTRRGFILSVALVAALALIYVYAPKISDSAPQLEPALSSYVTEIDSLRVWLDTRVAALLTWLEAAALSSSP